MDYYSALNVIRQEDRIALGVIYKIEKPTQESQLPQLAKDPLIAEPVSVRDISQLMEKWDSLCISKSRLTQVLPV